MSAIKYQTGSTPAKNLRIQNFLITSEPVGPTSSSGYWSTYPVPSGGWVIYLNKASNGPAIYAANNNTELISLTNVIAKQNYTTVQQCINYFNSASNGILVKSTPNVENDGLILYVDAGIPGSYPQTGTVWTDLSPSQNDMTINGSPTFTSQYFTFTSSQITKYAIKNPIAFPTGDITIEMWVKFGTTSLTGAPFSYASSGGDNDCLIFFSGGALLFYGPGSVSSGSLWTIPNTTSWYHIVRTRQKTSGQEKLYINGSLTSTTTLSANSSFTTNGSLVLAQEQDSTGGSFDTGQCFIGDISVARLYNKVLTASEISSNYNSEKTRFGY